MEPLVNMRAAISEMGAHIVFLQEVDDPKELMKNFRRHWQKNPTLPKYKCYKINWDGDSDNMLILLLDNTNDRSYPQFTVKTHKKVLVQEKENANPQNVEVMVLDIKIPYYKKRDGTEDTWDYKQLTVRDCVLVNYHCSCGKVQRTPNKRLTFLSDTLEAVQKFYHISPYTLVIMAGDCNYPMVQEGVNHMEEVLGDDLAKWNQGNVNMNEEVIYAHKDDVMVMMVMGRTLMPNGAINCSPHYNAKGMNKHNVDHPVDHVFGCYAIHLQRDLYEMKPDEMDALCAVIPPEVNITNQDANAITTYRTMAHHVGDVCKKIMEAHELCDMANKNSPVDQFNVKVMNENAGTLDPVEEDLFEMLQWRNQMRPMIYTLVDANNDEDTTHYVNEQIYKRRRVGADVPVPQPMAMSPDMNPESPSEMDVELSDIEMQYLQNVCEEHDQYMSTILPLNDTSVVADIADRLQLTYERAREAISQTYPNVMYRYKAHVSLSFQNIGAEGPSDEPMEADEAEGPQ